MRNSPDATFELPDVSGGVAWIVVGLVVVVVSAVVAGVVIASKKDTRL